MADVHEFILFGFRRGYDREAQFRTMSELGVVMNRHQGLQRREWYFSERDQLWVTHLTWVDEESIEAAGPALEADEHAMELFARIETETLVYAKFELAGSARGSRPESVSRL